jgi:hypothetical protein
MKLNPSQIAKLRKNPYARAATQLFTCQTSPQEGDFPRGLRGIRGSVWDFCGVGAHKKGGRRTFVCAGIREPFTVMLI